MENARLRQIIAERLCVPLERVTSDADLQADLGGDSLAFAELTALVESRFGMRIPTNRLLEVTTVGQLEALLAEFGEGPSPPSARA